MLSSFPVQQKHGFHSSKRDDRQQVNRFPFSSREPQREPDDDPLEVSY